MTELAIRGLSKHFGDVAAVDGFELEIGDHELISLLGPSGCGKTTTLRCIAGFEEPTAGHILFDGRDIVGLPPERRNIGMVFQNYALFPHMTVRQNLAFGLEMRGIAKSEMAERIVRVLATVQLGDLRQRRSTDSWPSWRRSAAICGPDGKSLPARESMISRREFTLRPPPCAPAGAHSEKRPPESPN